MSPTIDSSSILLCCHLTLLLSRSASSPIAVLLGYRLAPLPSHSAFCLNPSFRRQAERKLTVCATQSLKISRRSRVRRHLVQAEIEDSLRGVSCQAWTITILEYFDRDRMIAS